MSASFWQVILHRVPVPVLRAEFAAVALAALLLVAPGQAQLRKPRSGPRALAVLAWSNPGQSGASSAKSAPRLVPITILEEGRYYDAALYRATPRPMALEPETVYEAQRAGTPVGLFTVTAARQVNGTWIGEGRWRPERATPQASPKQVAPASPSEDEDQPPVLRRPGSSGAPGPSAQPKSEPSGETRPPAQPKSDSADDAQPPVLRRPGETGAGQSSPPAQTASSGQEGKSGAQRTGVPTPTDEEPEQDPNRPVLRRGKPAPQKQTGTVAAAQRKPAAPAPPQVRTTQPSPTQPSAATTPAAAAQPEFLPAISDAAPTDTRNFAYQWTPPAPATDVASGDEQQRMTGALQAMASAEVRAFARAHGAAALGKSEVETGSKTGEAPQPAAPFPARRGARTRRPPASASTTNLTFHEVIVRGFDLDLSNAAVLVYSGAYRAVSNTYYVTVVARVDLNGEPRKLFSSVTNSAYLDSIPRLEVLDAVDADGDGRGELLFRQTWQAGQAFGLYRVGPDQMIRLFESAPRATS